MRVLVANYHARVVGGVETYLQGVLPLLSERVSDVALLTSECRNVGRAGVPPEGVPWLVAAADTPAAVVAAAANWKPDVVFLHGLGNSETESAIIARFPTVYFIHNYDASCVSGTKCHQFPAQRPCRRKLGFACLALWYPRRCGGLNPVVALHMYRATRTRQGSLKRCKAVVVASRDMAAEMVGNGVPANRVHCLPPYPTGSGLDPTPPRPRPFTGRILFVGRLTAIKGWAHLLNTLPLAEARLGRSLTLVVAGDGPDRSKFEEAARRARRRAEFLGWVSPERRDAEMRAADLLVVPSVWPEPFGLVGVEAGCVGLPSVAYAVGGIPDWLEPRMSGESAPGGQPDPRELAAAVVRALTDPGHWQRLRVGAWRKAKRFSADAHVGRLIPILEAACS